MHDSDVRSELDRVGASFRKAGAADYITVTEDDDTVRLIGPPREHRRHSWLGPECQALELLAGLPDVAGVEAVLATLTKRSASSGLPRSGSPHDHGNTAQYEQNARHQHDSAKSDAEHAP